jgi:hypothetical protein
MDEPTNETGPSSVSVAHWNGALQECIESASSQHARVFVDVIPLGATGRMQKGVLRERLGDHLLRAEAQAA